MISCIIIHVKSGSRHFPYSVHVCNRDLDKTSYLYVCSIWVSATPHNCIYESNRNHDYVQGSVPCIQCLYDPFWKYCINCCHRKVRLIT